MMVPGNYTDKGKWAFGAGRIFVLFCFVVLLFSGTAHASYSVVLVLSSEAVPYRQAADALKDSLAEQGVYCRDYVLDDLTKLTPVFLNDVYKTKMWVAIGSRAASHLHTVLPDKTPLVYCMVADPEKIGLDPSQENVVGVSVTKPVKEQFAIIEKVIPNLRSIAMLYRSSSRKSLMTLIDVKEHLPADWTLEAIDVDKYDSMADAIAELFQRDVDMIWTMADSSIYNRATVNSLLLSSLRQQVPVFGFSGSFVKAGALLGLDADPVLQGEYAASLVVYGFDENASNDRPVSSGVTIAVNMVVANRLGISLPADVVQQARVIGAH